uniref:Variable lymphocyte receptor A cassette n=1 Tax=Petromyzon marinus TaxID=7757 RepID=S4S122_PETMA
MLNNQLKSLLPGVFDRLTKLTLLDLSTNQLHGLF